MRNESWKDFDVIVWLPGEMADSAQPPEAKSETVRGTLLVRLCISFCSVHEKGRQVANMFFFFVIHRYLFEVP